MKSQKPGKNILNKAEVVGITRFGIWVLVNGHEYFLDYEKFPWFKSATVKQIYNLQYKFGIHLRWPDIDVDLEVGSLNNLKKYPLKSVL